MKTEGKMSSVWVMYQCGVQASLSPNGDGRQDVFSVVMYQCGVQASMSPNGDGRQNVSSVGHVLV